MAGNAEWYKECRKHAVATNTLEEFQRAVERVTRIHEGYGGNDPTTIQWFRPMCHNEPTQLEFQTAGLYGCIAFQDYNLKWSVNT